MERLRKLALPAGLVAGFGLFALLYALTGDRILPAFQGIVLFGVVRAELSVVGLPSAEDRGPLVTRPAFQRRAMAVLLLGAGAMLLLTSMLADRVSVEDAREWIRDLGVWGPILLILVLAGAMLFSPVPNIPFFIAAGLAWGTPLGAAYSLAGQVLGASCAFWISRKLGRRHLARFVGERTAAHIDRLSTRLGPQVIFWARMVPVISFDLASYAAGLTAMRYIPFVLAAALGSIIPTVVVVHFGESLDGSLTGILISVALVAVAILVPTAIWGLRNRSNLPRPSELSNAVRKLLNPPDVNSV